MREIREQTDQRLQAVLTPEQWERFKQMRDEMGPRRRRRGRGMRE
jgi:Spy/CpxP family protein refolding chaperone